MKYLSNKYFYNSFLLLLNHYPLLDKMLLFILYHYGVPFLCSDHKFDSFLCLSFFERAILLFV